MKLKRFFILYVVFLTLLAGFPFLGSYYFPEKNLLIPYFWKLFGVFAILTLLIYLVAYWRMQISDRASGQALLGSVTVKLLICMILAFIYLNNIAVDPTKFLLNFFYLYFFHTVFEIYSLLCSLRNQKLK